MWVESSERSNQLNVSILRYGTEWSDSNRTQPLFSMNGVLFFDWTQISHTLNSDFLTPEVQILIDGQISTGRVHHIAIDDISLMMGTCDKSNLICLETGKTVPHSKICDFHWDCPSGIDEAGCGTCDFETG